LGEKRLTGIESLLKVFLSLARGARGKTLNNATSLHHGDEEAVPGCVNSERLATIGPLWGDRMRATTLIVIVLLAAALILYWTPLSIPLGDAQLILGGYPWQAPTPQARSIFINIGVALTVAAVVLAALAIKFGRDLEGEGWENEPE